MRNLLVGALLTCAAATVAAQQLPSPPGYIGAGYGVSRYHDFCDRCAGSDCDEDGSAWRVQAGYMVRPWIGMEGAYIHFGTAQQPGFLLNPPAGTTALPSSARRPHPGLSHCWLSCALHWGRLDCTPSSDTAQ